jgi:hypothetical protein
MHVKNPFLNDAKQRRKCLIPSPFETLSMVEQEERRHDLIALQDEFSEVLYKRENEIQDLIEQEKPVTLAELILFFSRKVQHLQEDIDRLLSDKEREQPW